MHRLYYTLRRWILGEWHSVFVNDELLCAVKTRRKAVVFEFEQQVMWSTSNVVRIESPRYSAAVITVNYTEAVELPGGNIQVLMERQ